MGEDDGDKTYLQHRVRHDNVQPDLEGQPPGLDDRGGEKVGEYLARKRRDAGAECLANEDVAEGLKVRVTSADDGVS
jgi:hypothetical protein